MHVEHHPGSGADRYVCEVCKARFVVPVLARDCEDKHLDQRLAEAKKQH